MPKVSVVVPVYKTEKYIERCTVSLFEQTLDSLEILFIDDCTPDNSIELLGNIIDKYRPLLLEKKSVVRILKMPTNSGQAAVRRHGILHATGDYIIHCDSDDWVDTNLYELLYNKAMDTGAEVVICPVSEEWSDHVFVRHFNGVYKDENTSCQSVLRNWYKNSIQMYAWNKLVKSTIFRTNDILPYEGINMWEDNGLMLRVLYYAKGLAIINNACYHYFRANEQAMTHGYGRDAVSQMIMCAQYLFDFFKKQPDFKDYEKTTLAIKFLARINLLTTSFSGLREYYKTFPESQSIIPYIGKNAFSSRGLIRFKFVKYHITCLFVVLYKLKELFLKFMMCVIKNKK